LGSFGKESFRSKISLTPTTDEIESNLPLANKRFFAGVLKIGASNFVTSTKGFKISFFF
jgi:hypothetical protein